MLGRGLLLLLLASPAVAAKESPHLQVAGGRWLQLAAPPPILLDEEVRQYLDSGLTTTFAFAVEGRGGIEGGAQVEVRYHLWDEVYRAASLEADGSVRRWELPSLEELQSWWRDLRLKVLDRNAVPTSSPELRITLDVIPFSAQEEADTERWLSDSLARAAGADRRGSTDATDEGTGGIGQVLNTLLATSIRRRAVTSYRWSLEVPRREEPPGEAP
ncbi:MAG: hypothetical protein KDD47_02255 [Acidobacteria bacterium]|nr:hypothetical protein [Acidobacteriota bacterium]